jgi:predicted nuclease of predicted toxin-antitoxin system
MEVVLDAHLSPAIAKWINENYVGVQASSLTLLGLRDKEDLEIFRALSKPNTLLISKDSDFKKISRDFGAPPVILLLSIGNSSNKRVTQILKSHWPDIVELMANGERLIEIKDTI